MKQELQSGIIAQIEALDERFREQMAFMADVEERIKACLPNVDDTGAHGSHKEERFATLLYNMAWTTNSMMSAKRDLCEALSHTVKMED